MVIFGGWDGSSRRNDVWSFQLNISAWNSISPSGTPPSARSDHTAIYDPVRRRMIVFGGGAGIGSFLNEVWSLSLPSDGPIAWAKLTPSGTPPSARSDHTAIYDPVGDRMLVFGGFNGSSYLNDVWALSLSGTPVWTQLAPSGTPPSALAGHTAIYDQANNRMLVFGGFNGSGLLNDVWALSLSGTPAWPKLTPSGTPSSGRSGHTATYDQANNRMLVFGGTGESSYLNVVWALSLSGTPV
jgi:hypothetical protein